MVAPSLTDSLRYAADCALSAVNNLGLRQFTTSLVQVKSVGGSRPGFGTKTKTTTVLTYKNSSPMGVALVTQKDFIPSTGLYTDREYKIGPFVWPYNVGFASGGFDYAKISPTIGADPVEIFFLIQGPGMPAAGAYFRKISDNTDDTILYYINVKATGEVP
jgi:hypothetical protein